MVLAPSDAYNTISKSTFGEARQYFVEASSKGKSIPMGIGCSSTNMKTVIQTSRKLDERCAEDELFCWYRCQKLEEHDAHICSERNLGLQCVNPRGQVLLNGEGHGDYYPQCTNATHLSHPITPYPEIEQQDLSVCTPELWKKFHHNEGYEHHVELTNKSPNATEAVLSYTILVDVSGAKRLKARLSFNDVFGWLATGFANQMDEVHNGMNGGSVLVAMPGGGYSPVTGLDTSIEPSVKTYMIHPKDSAFRHWMTPVVPDETKITLAGYESTECFTALTFQGDHINGIKFNFDGEDELIWGGNADDHFMGYHGRDSRARFTINWNEATKVFHGEEKVEFAADDHEAIGFVPDVDVPAVGETPKDVDTSDVDTSNDADAMSDNSATGFASGVYTCFALALLAQYLYAN